MTAISTLLPSLCGYCSLEVEFNLFYLLILQIHCMGHILVWGKQKYSSSGTQPLEGRRMSLCDAIRGKHGTCKNGYLIDSSESGNASKRRGTELNLREVRPDFKNFNALPRSLYVIQKPVVSC